MYKKKIIPLCIAVLMLLSLFPTYGLANNSDVYFDNSTISLSKEAVEFVDITTEGMLSAESTDALGVFVVIQDENEQDDKRRVRRSVLPEETPHHTYKFYNGNQIFGEQVVTNGDVLLEPGIPVGKGEFLGWFSNYETAFDGFGRITVSDTRVIELEAKFSDVVYVTFKGMDGTGSRNSQLLYETKAVAKGGTVNDSNIAVVSPPGKVLSHWENNGRKFNFSNPVNNDVTLNAVFGNSVVVSFDVNDGVKIAPEYFVSGTQIDLSEFSTTRAGYDFGGWYKDKALTQEAVRVTISSNQTYYAKWIPRNDTPYTVFIKLEYPDKAGYRLYKEFNFKGTTDQLAFNGNLDALVAKLGPMPDGYYSHKDPRTVIADFEKEIKGDGSRVITIALARKRYKLILKAASLILNAQEDFYTFPEVKYGENIGPYVRRAVRIKMANSTRRFDQYSWFLVYNNARNNVPISTHFPDMPAHDLTLYSTIHADNEQKVTIKHIDKDTGREIHKPTEYLFYSPDGKNMPKLKVEDIINIPGYSHSSNFARDEVFERITTSDGVVIKTYTYSFTATIKYTRSQHNIIVYNFNGENSYVHEHKYRYGDVISVADIPSPTNPNGKVHDGWWYFLPDNQIKELVPGITMPDEDLFIFAGWAEPEIPINIHENPQEDSGLLIVEAVKRGELLDKSSLNKHIPPKVGVEFYEWFTYNNGMFVPMDFSIPIVEELNLYPVWKNEIFKVTYNSNGGKGTVSDNEQYILGSDAIVKSITGVTPPAGKVFLGWKSNLPEDNKIHKPGAIITDLIQDIKFTAQWGEAQKNTTLTYRANGGEGKNISVSLKINEKHKVQANTFTREGYSFANWNTEADGSGTVYNPGAVVIPNNKQPVPNTFYAQWIKDVIEVKDPKQQTPSTHVRIQFVTDGNGKFVDKAVTIYDVKKGTTFSEIKFPDTQALYTYVFDKWDPVRPTNAATKIEANQTYTAKFKKREAIATPTGPAPAGYVIIEFKAGDNGKLDGPSRFAVLLNADFKHVPKPTPVANTYYKFDKWSVFPTKVTRPQEFTASFVAVNKVVPNPKVASAPKGFVRIEFAAGANGELKGTKIYDVEKGTTFSEITVPEAQAHYTYEYDKWSPEIPTNGATKIEANQKYTVSFKKREAIATPTGPAPAGYVIIEFKAGDNGKLDGPSRFAVLLNADFKHVPKPTPVANTYYKFDKWSDFPTKVTRSQEFIASFVAVNKVVPNPTEKSVPKGFVRIEFEAGANGQLEGTKIYDVEKGTTFSEITVPEAQAEYTYEYDKWDPVIPTNAATKIEANQKYTVSFKKREAIATPTGSAPAGYVIIEFKAGDNGKLDGPSRFAVLLNADFKHVPKPTPVANTYYKFDKWSDFPTKVTRPQEFIASFVAVNKVVPNPTEKSAPEGFVRIEFKAGANGQLEGTKTYDVEKGTAFSEINVPTPKADTYYKVGSWSQEIPSKDSKINIGTTYTVNFEELDRIIKDPKGDIPAEYYRVKFVAGDNGTIAPEKGESLIYDLRDPREISSIKRPIATGYKYYKLANWTTDFESENVIIATANFAIDKPVVPNPTGDVPKGFVRINFVAGENGTIAAATGGALEYDVLEGTDFSNIDLPTTNGNTYYEFANWTPAVTGKITEAKTYKANFVAANTVVANPTEPKAPAGFVRINFVAGDNGTIAAHAEGALVYDVEIGTDFKAIKVPETKGNTYYKFANWTPEVTGEIKEAKTYTANFVAANTVVANPTEESAPEGFVRIEFKAGANGTIAAQKGGALVYDVLLGTDFKAIKVPETKGNTYYDFANWTPGVTGEITEAKTYIANFVAANTVVANPTEESAPEGFVRIEFKAGANGTIAAQKGGALVYDVLLGTDFKAIKVPETKGNTYYKFANWTPEVTGEIKEAKTYIANFVAENSVVANPTEESAPEGFVRIEFKAGANGTIAAQKGGALVYDVLLGTDFKAIKVPETKGNTYYKFANWTPEVTGEIKEAKTYTANFVAANTVVANPTEESAPEGFVRIEFKAGANGTIAAQKGGALVYDVLLGTDFKAIKVPETKGNTYYKFANWTPEVTGEIKEAKTYTANFVAANTVVANPTEESAPEGFVRIEFKAGANGTIAAQKGGALVYDVLLGTDFNAIKVPETNGNTYYKFANWTPEVTGEIKEAKTYIANFVAENSVVANPTEESAPEGFVRINFVAGDNGTIAPHAEGALVYDVEIGTDFRAIKVPTETADTYYKFANWTPALTGEITKEETYKANFVLENSVVANPTEPKAPEGFARITFAAGENGILEGTTVFDVKKGIAFGDITRPTPKANIYYKVGSWSPVLPSDEIEVKDNAIYTVDFTKLNDVIENPTEATPEGFVRIEFKHGENGILEGTTVFDVKKGIAFGDITRPTAKADTYYKVGSWSPVLPSDDREVKDNAIYTVNFTKLNDVIENPTEATPEGFARIEFKHGENGILEGTTVFDVKKGIAFGDITRPTAKANTYYKVGSWSPVLPSDDREVKDNAIYTVDFTKLNDVIENPTEATPEGFVRIEFKHGDNGILEGTTVFDVKKGIAFGDITRPTAKANTYYKVGSWSPVLPSDDREVKDNAIYTVDFTKLNDVIENPTEATPEGFVRIEFKHGDNGVLEGTTVFDVKKGIAFGDITRPTAKANTFYKVGSWSPVLPSDDREVKDNAIYTVNFTKLNDVIENPTEATPEGFARIEFKHGDNGILEGTTVFDVKKGIAFGDITRPTAKADTYYKVGSWSPVLPSDEIEVKDNAIYTVNFTKLNDVIENPTEATPEGFARIEFKHGENGILEGTTVFDVKKGIAFGDITRPTAKANTYYKVGSWSPVLPSDDREVKDNAIYTVDFTKLNDVIENPTEATPEGFARIEFKHGDNGVLEGTTVFDVKKGIAFGDITRPTAKANTYYKVGSWSPVLPSDDREVKDNAIYTVNFTKLNDVIENPTEATPEGFARIEFKHGDNGVLEGTTVFDVKKGIAFGDITRPTAKADTYYKVGSWSPVLPSDEIEVKDNAIYTVNFTKLNDVIENPTEATPEGFARIEFKHGENGILEGTTVFDVKKGIAFGDITRPTAKADTYYKVGSWSPVLPSDEIEVKDNAIYTVNFTKLNDVIENPTEATPEGFARIEFKHGENGILEGTTVFDVKKGIAFGDITRPTAKANTYYKVGSWSPVLPSDDREVKDNAIYTVDFTKLNDVIENPTEATPEGFARIEFKHGDNGVLEGTTVFDVKKGIAFGDITRPTAKANTYYKVGSWSPVLPSDDREVKDNAIYTVNFTKLNDVIENPTEATPEGFARIEFKHGDNGVLEGTTVFDVKKGIAFGDITRPTAKANTFYKVGSWSPVLPSDEIEVKDNAIYTVNFTKLNDVIENPTEATPEGFARIEFKHGENGILEGTTVFDVKKGIAFGDITRPTAKANTYYKVGSWSPVLPSDDREVKDNAIYTVDFTKLNDVIENPTEATPEGFVRIEFKHGDNGVLEGTTVFDVKKGIAFGDITIPTAKADTYYKVGSWSPVLPSDEIEVKDNAIYTVNFTKLNDVIENPTEATPEGFARIEFKHGENGVLEGTTVFDVKKGIAFGDITRPTAKANTFYKVGSWSPVLPSDDREVKDNAIYTVNFTKLNDVIENPTEATPEGFVRIKFKHGENGVLEGTTVFDVKKGTPFGAITKPTATPEDGYKEAVWSPVFPTEVESAATYTANFSEKAAIVPLDKEDAPATSGQHVRIKFEAGANGSLSGTTFYDVKVGTPFGAITKPTATPEDGYKEAVWSPVFPTEVESAATYTANFSEKAAIVPLDKEDAPATSGQHVRIKFEAGANGSLSGTTFYDVKVGTPFGAITKPTATPEDGYKEAVWSPVFPTEVESAATYTANFSEKAAIVPLDKEDAPATSGQHVRIKFEAGANGSLSGTTFYDVKVGTPFGAITKPTATPEDGYEEAVWSPVFPTEVESAATYTANFSEKAAIVPLDKEDAPATSGQHVRIKFEAGANGSLSGTMFYDVKVGTPFGAITKPTATPEDGYKEAVWSPVFPTEVESAATYTANFSEKAAIVPLDKEDAPATSGQHVRIKFEAGANGSLSGTTFYDVKVGTPFGAITKPTATPEDGYKEAVWSPVFPTEVESAATYTANFSEKAAIVPLDKEDAPATSGQHVRIKFEAGANGSLSGTTFYDVKVGTPFGAITKPTATPEDGYKEAVWSPVFPTEVESAATYTANFSEKAAIVPLDKEDAPATSGQHVRIKFEAGANGSLSGTTFYDVKVGTPFGAITKPTATPEDGYKEAVWSPVFPTEVESAATYTANFSEKAAIVPLDKEDAPATSGQHVRIKFEAGANGSLSGTTFYDVKVGTPFGAITKPTATPEDGYKEAVWSPVFPTEVESAATYTANFSEKAAIVPLDKEDAPATSGQHVRIKFEAGANGSLSGTTFYDVKVGTPFGAITKPTATPEDGYKEAVWSPVFPTEVESAATYTANFSEKAAIVPLDKEDAPATSGQHVRIKFEAGANGSLSGTTFYDVKVGTPFGAITKPTATPEDGYKEAVWSPVFPTEVESAATYTANFSEKAAIVPLDKEDAPATSGQHVRIKFEAGANGSLSGTTFYDVKVGTPFGAITKPTATPEDGYKEAVWSPVFPTEVESAATYTANFSEKAAIVPLDKEDAPATSGQHVRIKFEAGANGSLSGTTFYDVKVGTPFGAITKPTATPEDGYKEAVWSPVFPTEVESAATYTANFSEKAAIVPLDKEDAPATSGQHVRIKFEAGANGSLSGTTFYDVKVGTPFGAITKPTATPEDGYKEAVWSPVFPTEVESAATYTANFSEKAAIVPLDKEDAPATSGQHVRIKFEAGANGSLSGTTFYDVKVGTPFGAITKPTATPEDGYKEAVWSPVFPTEVESAATYTANFSEKAAIVPLDKEDAPATSGQHVRIKFEAGANGSLSGTTFYDVKVGTPFGAITKPTATPEDGYEEAVWSPVFPTEVESAATYTANFSEKAAIVPLDKEDAPATSGQHVRIKFEAGANGSLSGTTFYDVKVGTPFGAITKPTATPEDGYKEAVWSPVFPTEVESAATYTANFSEKAAIVPLDKEDAPATSGQHVRIKFEAGANGSLSGTTFYDVKVGTPFGAITKPTATPEDGYKEAVWSPVFPTEVESAATYTANFSEKAAIVPLDKEDAPATSGQHVRIKFEAGANGSLSGTTFYDVKVGTPFGAITKPTATPEDGYKEAVWSPVFPTEVESAATYTANFSEKAAIVPLDKEDAPATSGQHVRIKFEAGANGSLSGTTFYDVKVGTPFGAITKPTATPEDGYKEAVWSPVFPTEVESAATYTANFSEKAAIVPLDKEDAPATSGQHVRIKFEAGANGSLSGTTFYDVKVGTPFGAITKPTATPEDGYKEAVWSPVFPTEVESAATYTANFSEKAAIVPLDKEDAPATSGQHVRIKFEAGANGSLSGTTFYDVKVGTPFGAITKPTATPEDGYKEAVWSPVFPTEVESAATYTANFSEKAAIVPLDKEDAPATSGQHVRIKFEAGANGSLSGTTFYDVKVGTPFGAITKPTATPEDGYKEAVWSPVFPTEVESAATYTANFSEKAAIVPLDKEDAPATSGQHVRIKFEAGANGSLSGTTFYDVKVGTPFGAITKPTATPEDGYEEAVWSPVFPTEVESAATYTANFSEKAAIVPLDKEDAPATSGQHVRIKFEAGANGSLSGTMFYDVKVGTPFGAITKPTATPEDGYKEAVWSPVFPTEVESAATYTANFSEKAAIVPLDKEDAPATSGQHVRIKFEAGANGSLSGTTFYDVKVGTPFGAITKPTATPEDGYKEAVWSPVFPTEVESAATYTANFSEKAAIVPLDKEDAPATSGQHVRIKFEAGANGSLSGTTFYDVKVGTPFGAITKPTATPEDGYEEAVWSPVFPTEVESAATYTANFSEKAAIVPLDKEDAPATSGQHVRIKFEAGANGSLSGTTFYDVKVGTPFGAITKPTATPEDGYKEAVWSPVFPTEVESAATYTANFSEKAAIVPLDKEDAPATSGQHVRIKFEAGANGSLSGTTFYDVKVGTPFGAITKPTATPEDGYKEAVWSPVFPTEVESAATYTANFSEKAAIVPLDKEDAPATSGQHVRIKFEAGANGSLSGTTFYDVKVGTPFGAITKPTATPEDGYKEAVWSPVFPTEVESAATYTANFSEKAAIVPLDKEDAPATSGQHVRIKFEAGANGSLSGTTFYDVKVGTAFDAITLPTATPKDGYEKAVWSPVFPTEVESAATYTANFKQKAAVIPVNDPTSTETPDGYVRITFEPGDNGSLIPQEGGALVYDVLEGTDFGDIKVPTPEANDYYEFDKWSSDVTGPITEGGTYTPEFVVANPVVANPTLPASPEGFVRITFEPGDNGSLIPQEGGALVYDVLEGTDFGDIKVPTPEANDNYDFDKWSSDVTGPITEGGTYTPEFVVANPVVANPTLPAAPEGFVRITFEPGENGTLVPQEGGALVYDVLEGTDFGDIKVPTPEANDYYEFDKWSSDVTGPITEGGTYTPEFVVANPVVVNPTLPEAPEGFVRITFEPGDNGSLVPQEGGALVYDVLEGTDFGDIKVPTPEANDYYEFDKWSSDVTGPITEGGAYTPEFVVANPVVANPTLPAAPEGFVRITFEPGDNGSLIPQEGGALVYDVLEGTDFGDIKVPTPEANDNYDFDKWSSDVTGPITEGGTYTPEFVVANPVVANPTLPEAPEGFVRITFEPGDNGSLVPQEGGALVYDVLEGTDFGDIKVPTPEANDNYEFDKWSSDVTGPITEGGTYTPEFVVANPVVANPTLPAAPEGFVRITFEPGDNGSLVPQEGGALVYDVLEGTDFGDIKVPTPEANDYYEFANWTPALTGAITEGGTYTANFAVVIGDVEEIKGEPKVVCQNAEVDLIKYAKLTNPHSDVILVAYVKGTTTPLSSTKVVVATKTTYVVKARNNKTGEESVGIEIELDVMPEAIFTEISADNVEIAVGERATLTAIFNGEANATIEWFDENGVVVNDVVSGNNSSITVENTASSTKGIRVYSVKLTDACTGKVTEQKIEIEFYLDSKITIVQKNRFLFVANNNSATNGNYNFVEYQWFKITPSTGDRTLAPGIVNEVTYTPNKTKMTDLDLDAYYQLETITKDGRVLRTEPFKAQTTERFSYTLDVYPNPATVNSIITIESNIAPSEYGTASIEIYTTLGVRLKTLTVSSDKTTFELPTQGVYYIRFNSKYFDQTKTIIVK